MAFFEWNDSMSVGDPEFDDHHKKLIMYINQLFDAMHEGKGKNMIGDILKNLYDYTVFHFSKEEEKLAKVNYPGLQEQKKAHANFVEKLHDFYERYNKNDLFISVDVLDFLSSWLKNHILKTDMAYKNYLS